uniref:Sushi domain-containing protein n=1 Tax=Monopterus albus TaxID=43700 RepID=A0A3Q3IGI4_MONAL|nr:complement decay-accelerating factor-like isoform X2 [Monopterus albus]
MEALLSACGRTGVPCLLLLCLFIWKAAADCPKPQGTESIVLTDDSLLLNAFPVGTVVTLECAYGYEKEGGSETITCTNGDWTELKLTCKKMDCGPPQPQPNMSFNTNAGTLFGAVARVICDKGYQIFGSSYKTCYPTGWSGKARCEIVTCAKPAEVANGKSSWASNDDPKYRETIKFSCNEGYTLVGNDTIVCSETGDYDSLPPQCQGVTTEDRIATKMVTPTPTPTTQEVSSSTDTSSTPTAHSSSTDSSSTPTAHRNKTITTPAVSASAPGGRDILTAGNKSITTVPTPSSIREKVDGALDANKHTDYTPVIISVIGVSLVAAIVVFVLHKLFQRKKGRSVHGTVPIS